MFIPAKALDGTQVILNSDRIRTIENNIAKLTDTIEKFEIDQNQQMVLLMEYMQKHVEMQELEEKHGTTERL